jgi:hypothetical protein
MVCSPARIVTDSVVCSDEIADAIAQGRLSSRSKRRSSLTDCRIPLGSPPHWRWRMGFGRAAPSRHDPV